MSQKPNVTPPSSSEEPSGSEDEQMSTSDSEISGSDSGQKPQPDPKKTLTPPSATKPQPSHQSSSESEESGSDSDSPPKKPAVAAVNVKPTNTKPMASKPVKKDGSKPISTSTSSPVKSKHPPPAPTVEKDSKKAKLNKMNKAQYPGLFGSESEDLGSVSGSGRDSDSQPKKDPKPNSAKKTGSKPAATSSPAKSKQLEMTSPETATKGEKSSVTDEEGKKLFFQRLWSDGDEIVILEGLIDYKKATGVNQLSDLGAFHEHIKKSLQLDASKAQLADKIRKLKKKYEANVIREKDGGCKSLSTSHEQERYKLSKLIWGDDNEDGTERKKKKLSRKNGSSKGADDGLVKSNDVDMMEAEKKVDISRFVRYGGMSESPVMVDEVVKAGLELVESSKRAELEGRWTKLKEQELELYGERMKLLSEQAMVVLKAVKSSGN